MALKQLSVFAENKPGKLQKVMKILADNGIDIRAISVADSQDFGILRMIVSDADKAHDILKNAGCISKVNHVISVSVPNKPGALAELLTLFTDNGIEIEYMYSLFSHGDGEADMIIRTVQNDGVEGLLDKNGYKTITEDDLGII